MCNCLYCYRTLLKGEKDMHTACIKKFFGTTTLPVLDYTTEQLDQLALQIIQDQTSLTGVQPKLSLHLNEHEGSKRLTIVGLWGGYICKPQTSQYEMMPEVEDLTMHLAEVARIEVVPHTLMRMADDTLCYLTRRIDRTPAGEKIAMEDFYISAIKMDSNNQHIELVKIHENLGKKIGPDTVNSRAFVGELIRKGKAEFKTITYNKEKKSWSVGAKVEVMTDDFITTDPNKTKHDNLGNLPTFI